MASPFAALAARLAISTEEILKRNLVLDRSIVAARRLWPHAKVAPVGSFANGTSLQGSDVDIVVDIPLKRYSRGAAGRWATELKDELTKTSIANPNQTAVFPQARVPIVTYLDQKYQIGVDISFINNGIVNTEYVKQELDSRPYMRTMIILLKYWLKSRGYNKVYTGGLSSYGLALTVIGYFNVRKTIKARKCTREDYEQWIVDKNIYRLIIDYLTFWSCQWKLASTMLEPSEGMIYKKGAKGHCGKARNSLLCIADPTDPTNDVTNGTHKISKLRQAMKLLRDKIEAASPDIDEALLQELLETTGNPFYGAKREKRERKAKKDKDKELKKAKAKKVEGDKEPEVRRVVVTKKELKGPTPRLPRDRTVGFKMGRKKKKKELHYKAPGVTGVGSKKPLVLIHRVMSK